MIKMQSKYMYPREFRLYILTKIINNIKVFNKFKTALEI